MNSAGGFTVHATLTLLFAVLACSPSPKAAGPSVAAVVTETPTVTLVTATPRPVLVIPTLPPSLVLPTATAINDPELPSSSAPPSPTSIPPTATARPTDTVLPPSPTTRPVDTAAPPTATPTVRPSETPRPVPTNSPAPTAAQPVAPQVLARANGTGQTATAPLQLGSGNSRVKFTHNGARNFIVKAFVAGAETLLVNVIGTYDGARYLAGNGTATFDIMADGAWTVAVESLGSGTESTFSGRGAGVSRTFGPPAGGAWELKHDGARNFVVFLRCGNFPNLVQNSIGPFSGSRVVQFGQGPCFWEVDADGNWSLAPR